MVCPHCGSERTKKFGKNRNGSRRCRCLDCKKTFTSGTPDPKPLGTMRVDLDKAVSCLKLLLDGMSIRAVERFTGVNRDTICDLILSVGQRCRAFLDGRLRDVPVADVQVDEIWSFCGMKERTKLIKNLEEVHEIGDSYAYIALERNSKLIVGYRLGKREEGDTWGFAGQLKENTSGRFHLSTDGWKYYSLAMSCELGARIDYAQIIKSFVNPPRDKGKYCPPQIVSVGRKGICGNPNDKQTCTSHVERSNLTMRMTVRRWTRLTNAYSKSWAHHDAMLAIYICFYNFVRVHMTIKTTPAVASKLTDHAWTMEEMLMATAA